MISGHAKSLSWSNTIAGITSPLTNIISFEFDESTNPESMNIGDNEISTVYLGHPIYTLTVTTPLSSFWRGAGREIFEDLVLTITGFDESTKSIVDKSLTIPMAAVVKRGVVGFGAGNLEPTNYQITWQSTNLENDPDGSHAIIDI